MEIVELRPFEDKTTTRLVNESKNHKLDILFNSTVEDAHCICNKCPLQIQPGEIHYLVEIWDKTGGPMGHSVTRYHHKCYDNVIQQIWEELKNEATKSTVQSGAVREKSTIKTMPPMSGIIPETDLDGI